MADNYIEKQYELYQARKAAWEQAQKTKRRKAAETQRKPSVLFQNQTKKIVAVHDLSGVGRVSLMAVIPILSSMGFQVCPLPTAVLSTHTQYPVYSFLDLTDEMSRIIEKWEQLNIRFDTFYTGYLGSPRQAQIVKDFIRKFRRPTDLVVVDPVLGDNGSLYKGISEEMVTEMKTLAWNADIITPNLTEMFLLWGKPYQPTVTDDELKTAMMMRREIQRKMAEAEAQNDFDTWFKLAQEMRNYMKLDNSDSADDDSRVTVCVPLVCVDGCPLYRDRMIEIQKRKINENNTEDE